MKNLYKFFIICLLFLSSIAFFSHYAQASSITFWPFSNASIQTGENYTAQLVFVDSSLPFSGYTWTETVDYGDGSVAQSFNLVNQNPFYLNHLYTADGTYTIKITITNNLGETGATSATVNVSPNNAPFTINYWNNSVLTSNNPIEVNSTYAATVYFTDPRGPSENDTAVYNWGDGSISQAIMSPDYAGANAGSMNGYGSMYGTHIYTQTGVYTVAITITDSHGVSISSQYQYYAVVYDPSAGYVTGGGTITSPPGAYTQDSSLSGKAIFGFVSRYQNGANIPTGSTQFKFQIANFTFKSTYYDWLVISGAKAQYKGSGTIDGGGDFGFILTAIDGQISGGGGTDKFRIKITDKTTGNIIYDNQIGASDTSDPTMAIDSGSIIIHN